MNDNKNIKNKEKTRSGRSESKRLLGFMSPDGFEMTAAVTMVIMSAGGLVTAGPLCGPHSPHSHLHFHW